MLVNCIYLLVHDDHLELDLSNIHTGFSGFLFLIVTLKNIIERNFPEEYVETKLKNDSLTNMIDLCVQMSGEENYGRNQVNGNGRYLYVLFRSYYLRCTDITTLTH